MSKSAVIISVNVIGTDGKLINPGDPTGAPFLCYCNDISEADDLIMKSDRFMEFINNNILDSVFVLWKLIAVSVR